MKLISVLGLAIVSQTEAKGPKTPFRRRLEKTFNLVDEWSQTNLKNHPHATEKVAEKDNKTKFDHKFDRIRQAVLDQYEERLAEIKAECGDTDLSDCLAYQDCSGVGDRMNTVRGKPDVAMSEAFLAFVDDKWKRSVQKVFTEECGFKAERVAKMSERFWGMNNSFSKWAKQCRKWSGADCPSHCEAVEKKGETSCQSKS